MMKYKTIREATEAWVSEMDRVPTSVCRKLCEFSGYLDMQEVTSHDDPDDYFPMWDTMFSMRDSADVYWIENHLDVMDACGFRVYESEDFGYVFGIDGAGYSFYEAHWIPLYKARGLQWHEEGAE